MATRTITGTIHHIENDTPWVNGRIQFSLVHPFATSTIVYPTEIFCTTLDINGSFSVVVSVPDDPELFAHYRCTLPDGTSFEFQLAYAITSADLQILIGETFIQAESISIQVLIDAHASRRDNPHHTTAAQTGAEPLLGNPLSDDYVLSSKVDGTRQWIMQQSGSQGPQGPKGDDGNPGPAGADGAQGPKGDTGDTGPQGLQGERGIPGATGAKGDKGDTGDQGPPGADGAQGAKGDKGDTGDPGDPGATGATGATGPQGEKGDKGDTGATGATGAAGATGAKGDKGDQGDPGAAGAKGDKGDKGDTGDPGPTPPLIAANDADVPLIARGFSAGQTGNLQEWQAWDESALAHVDASGDLYVPTIGIGALANTHETAIGGPALFYLNIHGDPVQVISTDGGYGRLCAVSAFLDLDFQAEDTTTLNVFVLDFFAQTLSTMAKGISSIVGANGEIDLNDSQSIGYVEGMAGAVYNFASSVNWTAGLYAAVGNYSGGAGSNDVLSGVYIEGSYGDGPVTDNYGLFIGSQVNANNINSYSMYTDGGAHRFGDYLDLAEISTPTAPSNTHARLFSRDNAGKTELCVLFASGAVQVIKTEA